VSTPRAPAGTTRTCPHCRATILDSATVCPACRHHLRFEAGASKRPPQTFSALKVDGTLKHHGGEQAWEYSMLLVIRNARGEEVARQVVGVGAILPEDQRTFTLAVEITAPPEAVIPVGTAAELRAG
jgi:hypothetical protein